MKYRAGAYVEGKSYNGRVDECRKNAIRSSNHGGAHHADAY